MRILRQDFRKGTVELKVDDPEDLWYLSHLIDQGDLVRGKTTRKVKLGDSENAKTVKKVMTVTVEAEALDFSADGTELRINGKVKEAPEDVPHGSYHAISLELGTEFTLQKKTWLEYQKNKLKEATEKKATYLLCLFDREEALFALTTKSGYEMLTRIKGEVPKKSKDDSIKKDFYAEILKLLEEYASRYKPENIIIASPAFYKEEVFKRITNPQLKEKIVLATCSDVEETSLDEVIKRPELAPVLKSSRIRKEKMVVDELLMELNKNNLAVYGWKETQAAVQAGAVNKLLLTDEFIKKKRAEVDYTEVDELMKMVDSTQGEVHIISAEQESGKKLNGLGGIAAVLRYKSWK
ncbi:mRNA surveillance protein pelota [Candidatus Woesearchaeota archaeon]|nr:mRNA surveillance protein pelota [Candidatus Woesearchaeota archaeon]